MLVLSSTVASLYYNCCTDGSTSPGNYGYPLVGFQYHGMLRFGAQGLVLAQFKWKQ
jgi:hypothetical protein